MSNTVKTFLALSLLLNLLLAGFILGHACRNMMADRLHQNIESVAAALPEEKSVAFKQSMGIAEKDAEASFKQLDAARDKAIALMKAKQFDKKAFLAQTKEMERIHGQAKQILSTAIANAAENLDRDERADVAELLRRPQMPGAPAKPPAK